MSHFITLVVIPEGTVGADVYLEIERLLAPFQENNMDDCPREYMEFFDREDELRKEYEEGTVEKVVMPDGRLLNTWDKEFQRKPTKKELEDDPFCKISGIKEVPKELEHRMVPFTELYDTFEIFALEWHGYKKRDDTYARYGYWENPNAKWDWYEIGGRWAGYFLLQNGKTGIRGRQYNLSQHYEKSQKADVCYNGDIDWETMREEAAEDAERRWNIVHEAWEGLPEFESWESVRERHGSQNIEAARKEYHDQPRVKACNTKEIHDQIGWMAQLERYQVEREDFIMRAMDAVGVSHSIIKDGKWYEHGRMGWWGVMHDEKDQETWNSMFTKMIDELPDRAVLAAVDCHI